MAHACRWCILTSGLKGSEVASLPQTEEEFFQHIERIHHIPVRREGETMEAASERFQQENPEAGGPNCRCPDCQRRRSVSN